jgi:hypothetical protein
VSKYFNFFLGDNVYFSTVVTGILDMRPGKHDLHFLIGIKLLPHAFVNIPDEKMNFGVYFFFFFFFFLFYFEFYSYIYS